LFLATFSEKGIVGELGEMKIPLNPYAKYVTQRPYRMNLMYKQKLKEEIDPGFYIKSPTNLKIMVLLASPASE
jgi:hypothetical protein